MQTQMSCIYDIHGLCCCAFTHTCVQLHNKAQIVQYKGLCFAKSTCNLRGHDDVGTALHARFVAVQDEVAASLEMLGSSAPLSFKTR